MSGNSEPIEKKKRNGLKARLLDAYKAWLNKEDGSLDRLMEVVRKFAYVKVYHLEHEFKDMGSAETADDWAQEISIKVWMGLDETRTPETFYAWVHRIAYNEGQRAFNDLLEQKKTMVPLMVPVIDESGVATGEEEDNPEIYADDGRDKYVYIPASVTGVDLKICKAFLTGVPYEDKKTGDWKERSKTYAEVAEELSVPVSRVQQRLKRLRDRLTEEKTIQKEFYRERWEKAKNWKVPAR